MSKIIKYSKLNSKHNLLINYKKIDTVILDRDVFFNAENIIFNNKKLNTIILDLNNIENFIDVNLNSLTTIKNISFLNYPMFEGLTIPIDITNHQLGIDIWVSPEKTNIRKINILLENKVDEIIIDDDVDFYEIKKEKVDLNASSFQINKKKCNNDLKIELYYKNDDKTIINYDKLGNKKVYHEELTINSNDSGSLDLRKYQKLKKIKYSKDNNINKLILTSNVLKNKEFKEFYDICLDELLIFSDNEMKFEPCLYRASDVKLNIIKNTLILERLDNGDETYIYVDDTDKLKIIEPSENKKYKFLFNGNEVGIIINYKKDLKFDLIINNKNYHINKIFVNWWLNNKGFYDQKIIPNGYNYNDGYKTVFDYKEEDIKFINDYIFDYFLEELSSYGLYENFEYEYQKYLKYLKHLSDLINRGYSYKALLYLHKNNFNNITGIKNDYYNDLDDHELINVFNELGKKLTKKNV